ncbi:hypothetical protein AVEN_132884-1 [Araneus ventricosus]|uniref:Uncharacterized protein n=1 Tax=Araneus ventricosus TaxID=182803 RepID=A0A4Y2KDP7_ARAVE|nr:hypothetical protein AVEN_132884-1 [Araneus ventricosus]
MFENFNKLGCKLVPLYLRPVLQQHEGYIGTNLEIILSRGQMTRVAPEPASPSKHPHLSSEKTFSPDRFCDHQTRLHGGSLMESVIELGVLRLRERNHQDTANPILRCNMNLEVHFLHSHLESFPGNLDAVVEQQGGRFYKVTNDMEKMYKGRSN